MSNYPPKFKYLFLVFNIKKKSFAFISDTPKLKQDPSLAQSFTSLTPKSPNNFH